MSVSSERRQFIANLANDEWIDSTTAKLPEEEFDSLSEQWDRREKEFLASVTDPLELHLFVSLYNLDSDFLWAMRQALDSPACSLQTAKLVFWLAQGDDLRRYAEGEDVEFDDDRDYYLLARRIEDRCVAGEFKEACFSYDPAGDIPIPHDGEIRWQIASMMYGPHNYP